MLNHRLINAPHEPKEFMQAAIKFLEKFAKNKKVFCALSGGIDSSAVYLLLKKASIEVLPVFIDHGLMRMINGVEEKDYIKKFFPDVRIVDIQKEFLPKIYGVEDAEKKRKIFKLGYSDVISHVIKTENCDLLADGTILPDIEESFGVNITDLNETMSLKEELELKKKQESGFVKSQHNVEIEYDVEATIQPVASLTKAEVRNLLKHFEMPDELVYRKAFPGPALAARIIGPITRKNLPFEKQVHDIVESSVNQYYAENYGKSMIINKSGEQEPFQVFAAISENLINSKVTGLVDNKRIYKEPLVVKGKWDFESLTNTARKLDGYSRLLYELSSEREGKYDIIIRSVNSIDARTASVTNLSIMLLKEIAKKLNRIESVRKVFYDVTPKPPATIEYV
ncbi:MAG: hypothetical protein EU517_01550 [Promethearchaeota archaeon]|nr:MAG: hypothetical protein EU517_01550 [Candidatus Lokiarchaeota archaeon]